MSEFDAAERTEEPLLSIGEPGPSGDSPVIGVYGAPRPAVPERVPLAPRTKGCASGAGSLGSVEPGEFRRLPPWLKIQLPGQGDVVASFVELANMTELGEEGRPSDFRDPEIDQSSNQV